MDADESFCATLPGSSHFVLPDAGDRLRATNLEQSLSGTSLLLPAPGSGRLQLGASAAAGASASTKPLRLDASCSLTGISTLVPSPEFGATSALNARQPGKGEGSGSSKATSSKQNPGSARLAPLSEALYDDSDNEVPTGSSAHETSKLARSMLGSGGLGGAKGGRPEDTCRSVDLLASLRTLGLTAGCDGTLDLSESNVAMSEAARLEAFASALKAAPGIDAKLQGELLTLLSSLPDASA